MSKLRVASFTVSADGYGAGADQGLESPLGKGGEGLHEWIVKTRTFQRIVDKEEGETGRDDMIVAHGFHNVGAWIMGRNMFGPVRGPWPDDGWEGWWGKNPPYHVPVFVLTHHARDSIAMDGGTVFHFVTGGIEDALTAARRSAGGKDIRLGGGVSVIRQYLRAGLVDVMHIAVSPVLLGRGEPFFADIDLDRLGYRLVRHFNSEKAMHLFFEKI